MNFYQKIYGIITLLILVITIIIFYIFFDAPYSSKIIAESIAVLLSEILTGIFSILVADRKDHIAFHSGSYLICSFLYVLFTLLMTVFIKADISLKKFIVIHLIGLILYSVSIFLFYMSEHNIEEQDILDSHRRKTHSDFYNTMVMIHTAAAACFPDDADLKKKLHFLMEEFRYAADLSEKTCALDYEICSLFELIKESMQIHDKENFIRQMEKLKELAEIRKKIC